MHAINEYLAQPANTNELNSVLESALTMLNNLEKATIDNGSVGLELTLKHINDKARTNYSNSGAGRLNRNQEVKTSWLLQEIAGAGTNAALQKVSCIHEILENSYKTYILR